MAAMEDMCRTINTVIYHNTCPKCGKVEEQPVEVPDFMREILTGGNTENFCDKCLEEVEQIKNIQRQKEREEMFIDQADIPADFREWDSEKGNGNLARKIRDNRHLHIFVAGRNNCCKTRATAINLKLEAKKGMRCRFVRFSELAAGYARVCKVESENSMQYIRNLLNYDVLFIDDIGKRRITETAGELLYDLFDLIYSGESKTRVWITSNKSISDLAGIFENGDMGDAVVSRLDRMIDAGKMLKIEVDTEFMQ